MSAPRPVDPVDAPVREDDASVAHLRARLEALETRIADAVASRRRRRPASDDRFRGVFVSDAQIDALLADPGWERSSGAVADEVEAAVDRAEAEGTSTRLRLLQRAFALSALELDLVVVAAAPDLDARYEQLIGYLHDDLGRRRASVGLALELLGRDSMDVASRRALAEQGRLRQFGLLEVADPEAPWLGRTLRVPDRVTAFLLGDDSPDPSLEPYLSATVPFGGSVSERVADAVRTGTALFYAREAPGASGTSMFGAALSAVGLRVLCVDLSFVPAGTSMAELAPAIVREAGLTGSGLVLEHADVLAQRDAAALRRFVEAPMIVCLCGSRTWNPDWARLVPFMLEAPVLSEAERAAVLLTSLGDEPGVTEQDAATLARLRMRPVQIVRLVESAKRHARAMARELALTDLEVAARQLNSVSLDALSTRITPAATWDGLILPPAIARSVQSVVSRARHKELVQVTWRLGEGTRRLGTLALFGGPPGTGKTLAAEVIAGELGVDLYVVNLATVIDKYIGETEKNLEKIFDAAADVNGLLFFDEADALFGKRSEVKDARDRYANVEVAYLLQRLERFDGVAVLATNLSANLDEAFARRIDVTAQFKLPAFDERRTIWRISLPDGVPLSNDVDLDFLSGAFELSGGSIRNVCVGAAYLAAEEGTAVSMRHLVRSVANEHRKLGRLVVESEFQEHFGATLENVPAAVVAR